MGSFDDFFDLNGDGEVDGIEQALSFMIMDELVHLPGETFAEDDLLSDAECDSDIF